jgi:hypothetical protein
MGIDYLAVLVAAVAAWIFGAVWYGILGKQWMAALGKTMEQCKAEQSNRSRAAFFAPFVLAFIAALIIAWVLAGIMAHVGPITIRSGVISGAFVWFGFVLTTIVVNNAFAMRKPMLSAIDAGHWLGALLIAGAVIGAFGR